MARKSLFSKISTDSLQGIAIDVLRSWLWPIIAPGLTMALGYFHPLPLMYVALGGLGAFALTTVGLVFLDEWRIRRKIEGKLGFRQVRLTRHALNGGLLIGVEIQNMATFPIEVEITDLRTVFGNRVPSMPMSKHRFTIPAQGFGWWDENEIEVPLKAAPEVGTGQVEFKIRYGLEGKELKYEFSGKKSVSVIVGPQGPQLPGQWHDLP